MLKFLVSPELLFERGAVVLKFGKNFIFRSEIVNFWNQFKATDTWHQQRKTEKWSLSFIKSYPDFIMKSKSEMKRLYFWVKISIFIEINPFIL